MRLGRYGRRYRPKVDSSDQQEIGGGLGVQVLDELPI
jgi:hypothetical protein